MSAHETAPASPASIEEMAQMLDFGVRAVQATLRLKPTLAEFESTADPITWAKFTDAMYNLNDLHTQLRVDGTISKPALTAWTQPYPRVPIVENVLKAVGVAPHLSPNQQGLLVDTWTIASSSGRGRVYPLRTIARHLVPQILAEASLSYAVTAAGGSAADKLQTLAAYSNNQSRRARLAKRLGSTPLKQRDQ